MKKYISLLLIFALLFSSCANDKKESDIIDMIKSGKYYYELQLEDETITFSAKNGKYFSYQGDDKNLITYFDLDNKQMKIVDFEKKLYACSLLSAEARLFAIDGDALEFSKKEKVTIDQAEYDYCEYNYYSFKLGFVYDGNGKWVYLHVGSEYWLTDETAERAYITVVSYGSELHEDFANKTTDGFSEVGEEEIFKID